MSWNIFGSSARSDGGWFTVGLVSSFPNLGDDDGNILQGRACGGEDAESRPGCKVFRAPKTDPAREEVEIDGETFFPLEDEMKDQVMVFQYRGRFHAIDHRCPHSSYPLSRGTPFDIEDFGVVLSAGITCPKHDWSFDLVTGMSDRARYKLTVWQTEVREVNGGKTPIRPGDDLDKALDGSKKEVWVRRKPKIG